jgi:hypothetical protein
MRQPFAATAGALRDMAAQEQHRLNLARWFTARGDHFDMVAGFIVGKAIPFTPDELYAMETRVAHLEAAADLLAVLADRESQVRELDHRLLVVEPAASPR